MTKKVGVTVMAVMTSNAGIPAPGAMTAKGGMTVTVDGIEQDDQAIPLVDDRQEHWVEVSIDLPALEDSPVPDPYLWLPPIARIAK